MSSFTPLTIGTASIAFLFDSLQREVSTGVTDATLQQKLAAKVQKARQDFDAKKLSDAINELQDFVSLIQNDGEALSASEASRLVAMANALISRLGAGI